MVATHHQAAIGNIKSRLHHCQLRDCNAWSIAIAVCPSDQKVYSLCQEILRDADGDCNRVALELAFGCATTELHYRVNHRPPL